ncbi:hypothetical protein ABB28_03155 [Stenotrophomonas chelatiphaga]|uniref:Uncharacterized protein n=1 Tax=Stenotrophomonas chelatiphaga TaxID=517011 RepID=A0A0R0DFB3_9GAMM|nr:hypothetical protein ABB28_03155 [Stenotrophomonas chelatiphaga]
MEGWCATFGRRLAGGGASYGDIGVLHGWVGDRRPLSNSRRATVGTTLILSSSFMRSYVHVFKAFSRPYI